MKKLFLSTLLLSLPLLASAYDIAVENVDGVTIYYNYINNGTELEVTYKNENYNSSYSGEVNVPKEVTYMSSTRKVTSIGQAAFNVCRGLTSVTIPNSVTSIGDYAFRGCSGLTSITIPNSVTSIGNQAFYGCRGLTSVHITDLAVWCSITFHDNPLWYAHHLYLNEEEITELVIPNSVTSIGGGAFSNCSGLTSVTIPNSVTSIEYEAFSGCTSLTSVTIPNSVTSIGYRAFWGCSGLSSVTIPNSVTSIGYEAFYGCSGLTSVTIGNSMTSIGDGAFGRCMGLTSVTIPNSVTSIGAGAFSYCTGLTSVTIGNSVTDIGVLAFERCRGLTSVTIPNSVTSIGNKAFLECSGLTSVTIPNSVTSIGERAFQYCSGLTSVTIPNSVTSIGDYTFYDCSGLTSVVSKMENPCSINGWCFSDDVFNNTPLYVPKGTIDKYKSTDYWNRFLHIIEGNPYEYTLTYLVDGETYSTYTLEEGDAITPDEAPTKEGYTFSGWSEIPETMPASDVTITGTFVPNKYKLMYIVDGVEYKSSEIEFGSTIAAEENPTKEGYTFSGWSDIPETMPSSDVTITGRFTINTYTITYMVDNALLTTEEVTYGSTITPPASPKEGYEITWNSHPTTMPAYDVTIYGSYISTGINGIYAEESDKKVYTPDGKRIQSPKKGMNIIRKSDGTIKKLVVK